MTEFCALCARNTTRRWLRNHVPQVSGGMTGTGLAVVAAWWSVPGTAGDVIVGAGTCAVVYGLTGLVAGVAGWRPSLRCGKNDLAVVLVVVAVAVLGVLAVLHGFPAFPYGWAA